MINILFGWQLSLTIIIFDKRANAQKLQLHCNRALKGTYCLSENNFCGLFFSIEYLVNFQTRNLVCCIIQPIVNSIVRLNTTPQELGDHGLSTYLLKAKPGKTLINIISGYHFKVYLQRKLWLTDKVTRHTPLLWHPLWLEILIEAPLILWHPKDLHCMTMDRHL